jgi:hypothetical protein
MKKTLYDNCLGYQKDGINVVAVVLAKHWFESYYTSNKMPLFIEKSDYVVCKWQDFNDGEKPNIEGKTTIAICKNRDHAELVYKANLIFPPKIKGKKTSSLSGVYFKKQFSPPLSIGPVTEKLEEISIFPCNDNDDGFVDFRLLKGQKEVSIIVSYNSQEWRGTMQEMSEKLLSL